MKVVIAIDDSRGSQAAIEWVLGMTWPKNAQFVVLSILEAPIYAVTELGGAVAADPVPDTCAQEIEGRVARAERDLKTAGLVVRGRVDRGLASDMIVRAAASERADLVVVGSHGRTGLTRLLMGSVASHVLNHAPCSVLVVREPLANPSSASTTRSASRK